MFLHAMCAEIMAAWRRKGRKTDQYQERLGS